MKATILEKETARKLRFDGYQINQIAAIMKTTHNRVDYWVRGIKLTPKQKSDIPRKYHCNLQTLTNEDDISYYLLGAFMTDGCISESVKSPHSKRASISSNDLDWIENINNLICPESPIVKAKHSDCYVARYNSLELANWFISKECISRKSLTLKFPYVPNNYLVDFIRGCWDGDGHLDMTNHIRIRGNRTNRETQRSAYIVSASKCFIEKMSSVLYLFGINHKMILVDVPKKSPTIRGKPVNRTQDMYRLSLSSGEDVYNFCKLIYYPTNRLSMTRKQIIANMIVENWERKIQCVNCGADLDTNKTNRNKKMCKLCKTHKKAETRKLRYLLTGK